MKQMSTSKASFRASTERIEGTGPQGIGMAVAFDWGFATQLLITPYFPFLLSAFGLIKRPTFQIASAIITLLLSVAFFALGEGIRRGIRWTRIVQIVWNALGFLGGIGATVIAIVGIGRGNYWTFVPALILLLVCPLILWRLTRPVTGRWFQTVSSGDARKRHGGAWPWLILIWSIIGALLVATSTTFVAQ